MLIRNRPLYLCLALLSIGYIAVPPPAEAASALPLQITYRLKEKPIHCPADARSNTQCVLLAGKAVKAGTRWPEMRRLAVVGRSAPGLPKGCVSAATSGTLSGKSGVLHFKGQGYYCPQADMAWYRYEFNAAQARRRGLPWRGVIRYVGRSHTETFSSSAQ